MSADDLLQMRRVEHEELLARVVALLQADERVVAAWLFGSRGRQTADALSDLDLWVVVKDEVCDAIVAERQRYVAQPGKPVLLLESPGNAPARGGYLMALYPGQAGVHQIDWYWQRQSDASRPRKAVLLFDRVGIPQDTRQEQLDEVGSDGSLSKVERAARVTQLSAFFWAMGNIGVKGIVRQKAWDTVGLLDLLKGLVDEVKYLVGLSAVQPGREAWRTSTVPPVGQRDQLVVLRETMREMEALTLQIEAIGGTVQTAAIPYIYDFVKLAEMMIGQEAEKSIRGE
jgi:hypothetical protein